MTAATKSRNPFERRLRNQAVAEFKCPSCGARAGRPCRRKSTDWTGKRPLWKRAALHDERLALAQREAIELLAREAEAGNAGARKPRCRYHCGACQRHFASEAALDGHRVGDHALPNGHPEGRRCSAPYEDDRYGYEVGVCDVYERQEGVTIYFLTRHREGARERLSGSGDSAKSRS